MSSSKIVVSLTTTPARMPHLTPTLSSLLKQSLPADAVLLYVPRKYRRAEFGDYELPAVPAGVEIRVCDFDFGPATKVLPAVQDYTGTDTTIVYCDDDQIYDAGWLARLHTASLSFPGCGITDRGLKVQKIDVRSKPGDPVYRAMRIASLGLWRPKRKLDARAGDLVDIALGFSGVLVRPEFFPASSYEIPNVLWTVDDIWLSGQMAVAGIKIRQASGVRRSANTGSAGIAALLDAQIESFDRNAANQACVDYFRTRHGIWKA